MAQEVEVRLAHRKNESVWEVLLVSEHVRVGDILHFSEALSADLIKESENSPLKVLRFSKTGSDLLNDIYSLGEPVRYECTGQPWDLNYYQNVYATTPGSVEMPSAGRAFTWELLCHLQQKGIKLVFLKLHTGLSYLLDDTWENGSDSNLEEYNVPEETMENILRTKKNGGRVVAVGTTVVRALESAVKNAALSGWTNLYIDSMYQLQVADGIITGFHEPEASHLDILSAFVSEDKLLHAYRDAIDRKYLWHEFGDVNLII